MLRFIIITTNQPLLGYNFKKFAGPNNYKPSAFAIVSIDIFS